MSTIFQFCDYRSQRTFQKKLTQIFKFGCFSWYQFDIYERNGLDFLLQNLMLNRLAPISNLKNEKAIGSYTLFYMPFFIQGFSSFLDDLEQLENFSQVGLKQNN